MVFVGGIDLNLVWVVVLVLLVDILFWCIVFVCVGMWVSKVINFWVFFIILVVVFVMYFLCLFGEILIYEFICDSFWFILLVLFFMVVIFVFIVGMILVVVFIMIFFGGVEFSVEE